MFYFTKNTRIFRSNVGVVDSGFGTGEVSDVDMSYDTM